MSKKSKIEKYIQPGELPAFLRKIADALEGEASADDAYLVMIEGFKKLKINIRNEYGHTAVKVTAKPMSVSMTEKECPEAEIIAPEAQDSSKPKFKSLKKNMKASFKIIFKSVHAGTLPPPEVVEEFMADSKLMVSFEGYGDEYYDEYMAACYKFQQACNDSDVESAHKACDEINSITAHCHSRYK
ncbi:GAK system XXXCH domain-containing protein [Desulfovibrio sp. JC022]|uniref:GAK system XXXCH domain-containing protein n=1 Tax=Desulfovibrio sp. JC022 TaxID=2593642 RepID=UPI0013D275D3|nr:GAK system XXXCH domain-containing protein [Desulfovibrio sp. JC022]NDV22867.1 GAK system XXXCH domain-containing protein [Desulfovibrio sp. JC022]